jgi:hypothetical protein
MKEPVAWASSRAAAETMRKWTFIWKFGLHSCYILTFFAFIRLEAM